MDVVVTVNHKELDRAVPCFTVFRSCVNVMSGGMFPIVMGVQLLEICAEAYAMVVAEN